MSEWREQYGRMLRWRERLDWPVIWVGDSCDTLYTFAQTCYHLVDWLESDSGQPIRRAQADQHVHASPVLAVCRDICHGSKHAVLEAKNVETETRIETMGRYELRDESTGALEEKVITSSHIYVRVEGEVVQDLEFADRCIEAWNVLLRAEGLKPGEPPRFT